jgi:hypothetical protein
MFRPALQRITPLVASRSFAIAPPSRNPIQVSFEACGRVGANRRQVDYRPSSESGKIAQQIFNSASARAMHEQYASELNNITVLLTASSAARSIRNPSLSPQARDFLLDKAAEQVKASEFTRRALGTHMRTCIRTR